MDEADPPRQKIPPGTTIEFKPRPRCETHPVDFKNGVFLAPMVRENSLPFRLLCQHYGATTTWTEALVDHRLVKCVRTESVVGGTKVIDFNMKGLPNQRDMIYPILRICDLECPLVVQVAFSGVETVKSVVELLKDDASALEINAGCVKRWAVQGGMGNAILSDKEKLKNLISEIKRYAHPAMKVSIKIRILETVEETVKLVEFIKEAGADACVIHTRLAEVDREGPAHWTHFKGVMDKFRDFPLVLNGGIFTTEDKIKAVEITGCKALMIGRGASSNPSIFGITTLPKWTVIRSFLILASIYATQDHMISAAVRGIMREPKTGKMGVGLNKTMWVSMNDSTTFTKMCGVVGLCPKVTTYHEAIELINEYTKSDPAPGEYHISKKKGPECSKPKTVSKSTAPSYV